MSIFLLLLALLAGAAAMTLGAYAGDLGTMIGAGVALTATCAPGGGLERLIDLAAGELDDVDELHLTLVHLDDCPRCAANFRVIVLLRAGRRGLQGGPVAALPGDRIPPLLM